MRSNKQGLRSRAWMFVVSGILLAGVAATSVAHWMEEKQLTVFSMHSVFSVVITERDSSDYIALNDILEKLGALEVSSDGDKLKLRFKSQEASFENGAAIATIGSASVKAGNKIFVEHNRALLPLQAVPALLQHFLNTNVSYREASRRLFVGDAGTRFALELKKGDSTQLVLSFSTPVSPHISTEPGKLKMVFRRDPLAMESQSWQFDDDLITSASYADSTEPELTVSGSKPLLATFADASRTIAITPAPMLIVESPSSTSPPAETLTTPIEPAVSNRPAPQPGIAPVIPVPAGQNRYLVVIDASHGGEERGAALNQTLAEKDVTLAVARSLRTQLQARGLSTLMVRDGDHTLPLDQRATLANTSKAAVYLAIHAGGLNRGVRVYTSMLSPADASAGLFVPWEKAQAGFVRSSRLVATKILDELRNSRVRVPTALLPAPVRPLNNIAAAAVAIEVGPLRDDMESVNNPDYQEAISKALASALAMVRPKVEAAR